MEIDKLIAVAVGLPRRVKQGIQSFFDILCLSFLFLIVDSLDPSWAKDEVGMAWGASYVAISAVGLWFAGVYKVVTRFAGVRLLASVVLIQLLSSCALALLMVVFAVQLDAKFVALLFLLSVFVIAGSRLFFREIFYYSRAGGSRLLIYGAGKAGAQLLTSLRQDPEYKIVGFIDDQEMLQGRQLHGINVFSPLSLSKLIATKRIDIVVLAMPSASREEVRFVLERLESLPIAVKTVPAISALLDGSSSFASFEEVRVEELLGRERVMPDQSLLKDQIFGKVVLVTGAGGSIGSELCRQILMLKPKKVIMVELSEYALYKLVESLDVWGALILPVMGSVTDARLMRETLRQQKVDTVYHAAACKHVPMVEANPFAALQVNTIGTKVMLEASVAAGVSSFTLVSTDKAVRPTNIMGASKRLAEIACQIDSAKYEDQIKIAMVRFGNVVGSSGSAIPKFKAQIERGGPVTVTHPEITRYFMVVEEAVELVLQASALAKGGEVFVLDMGDPVKIADLAKKLIRFSGLALQEEGRPRTGAIEIIYTGLRPGEKLYEELLISGVYQDTSHPKIKKIEEEHPSEQSFSKVLAQIADINEIGDETMLRHLLSNIDIGYLSGIERPRNASEEVTTAASPDTQYFEKSNSTELGCELQSEKSVVGVATQSAGRTIANSVANLFFAGAQRYFLLKRPLTLGVRCVVLNAHREVLLVKHTYLNGWHLPGGGINVGEAAESGMRRELIEEARLEIVGHLRLVGIYHHQQYCEHDHVVLFQSEDFRKLRGDRSLEIAEQRFFNLDTLPEDIDKYSRKWIFDALGENAENSRLKK